MTESQRQSTLQAGSSPGSSGVQVVVAPDAIEQLAAIGRGEEWGEVLVVMDPNTRVAVGERVSDAMRAAGVGVEELLLDHAPHVVADDETVARVGAHLHDQAQVVAVGSGTITDVTRYAVHLADREFISVPSAASMDGYASSVAPLQRHGVKVTFPARAPIAIFADPRVVAAAPLEMTRSGVGDVLGKVTAQVDWLASNLLYGEPFRVDVAADVRNQMVFVAEHVEAILQGDAVAVQGLLDSLIGVGFAMAAVGNSRPASGCEHHASHFWDLLAARGMREHAPHGLQVGYATGFAMRLQRFTFGGGLPPPATPAPVPDPLGPDARAWLGDPTDEIVAAVAEKQARARNVPDVWPAGEEQWTSVQLELAPLLGRFELVESALRAAEIPAEPGYLDVDAASVRAAFRYANRLRARFTVLDFLEEQGLLDRALDAVL